MSGLYRLIGKKVVECPSIEEWGNWFENQNRRVAQDEKKGVRVSTIFLSIDHRFDGRGPPLLFETMIFGGPHDGEQARYSTYQEAEIGHRQMCELAFPEATP